MEIKPIKKVNIAVEIENQIQTLITEHQYKPGDKLLSERELCEKFDVSRTSIREALRGLISRGFLEKKRDGTYVREYLTDIIIEPMQILLDSKKLTIREIFEARLVVETQNARLAALKATDDEIILMGKHIEVMKNRDSSIIEIMDSSIEFHHLISKATKNRILSDWYIVIHRILEKLRKEPVSISQIMKSLKFHYLVYEKIIDRDEDGAEQAMKEHILKLMESIGK